MPFIRITNLPLHADLISLLSYLKTAWGGASVAWKVTSLEQSGDDDTMVARVELKQNAGGGGGTAAHQQFETLAQRVRQIQSTRYEGSCVLQAQAFYNNDATTADAAATAGGGGGGSAPQQQPKKKKKKKKAKKKATTQDETDADNGNQESATKRKKKNQTKSHRESTTLARDFYQHLLDHPDLLEQASDRDGTHIVFEAFMKTKDSNHSHSSNNHRTEALVMTRLRQLRFVKSKRVDDSVVMMFADKDGDFPEAKAQIEKLKERSKESQQNKHNVRVGNAVVVAQRAESDADNEPEQQPADSSKPLVVTARGKAELLTMKVEYFKINGGGDSHPSDDSSTPNHEQKLIQLDAVRIQGPCARHFAVTERTLQQLPMRLNSDNENTAIHNIQLTVTVPASRIGLLRASVHCEFTETLSKNGKSQRQRFKIVRWVKVKAPTAVNEAVGQVLQPEAPYKRPPRRRYYESKPAEIFDPPADKNQGEVNPFRFLPQHGASPEVINMLEAGEFETAIDKWPPEQGEDGDDNVDKFQGKYASFWKKLMWASEFQEKQDIMLFDMENTQLKREGRFFSLHVPGLAENRPSVLRGDIVQLTWNKKLYKGRVEHVRLLDVMLLFHPSFHQSYNPGVDRVDVRFTLSRMSFRLAHDACEKAETSMGRTMLLPSKSKIETLPPRKIGNLRWANRNLNQEQCFAIEKIVKGEGRKLPFVVFGPPGTGKTTTVVEAIYQLAKHQEQLKILVVAPSNDAADILVERLAPHFPPSELTRILAYTRSVETLPAPIRRYASGDKTNEQQKADILASRIVVATVNLAARFSHWGVPVGYFDVLVVDEAGHATEPEAITVASTLMAFDRKDHRPGQIVLAGDPQQLGPVITSALCRTFGLGVSYMERLTKLETYQRDADGMYPEILITKLVRNYRSHPAILKLPNEMFYDNDLQTCGDRMVTHSLAKWEHLPNKAGFPILFHSVEGENLREGNSPSWFNPQEAELVLQYVHLLLNDTKPPLQPDEIGIITPYARQAQKIRKALETQGVTSIKVGSVEMFQGQERRCIILSTVRSESEHLSSDMRYSLGFVASPKRFNVAITRAKSLLIVVGCARLLALDKTNWRPLLNYCLENHAWCGEEWNPDDIDSDSDDGGASAKEDDEEDWEVLGRGPSIAMEQEGIAAVFHEE